MGNFSRDTFDKSKHYVGVRLQQGVPLVDADWNEQEDIRKYDLQAFRKWFVGNGVPSGNNGFRITAIDNANDFIIKGGDGTPEGAGRCLVEGWEVINESDLHYTKQPLYNNQTLANDWGVNPVSPLNTPAEADRKDLVYLDTWEREVDSKEDDNLTNPKIGIETCVRLKREWVVRVAEGTSTPPSPPRGHAFYPLAVLSRQDGAAIILQNQIEDKRQIGLSADKIAAASISNEKLAPGTFSNITGVGTLGSLTVIGGWPQSSFGDGTGDRVVAGTYQGQAVLGAHNNALNAWADLIMQRDGGNVGIGTTAPKAKLDVSGDLKTTGNADIGGGCTVNGSLVVKDGLNVSTATGIKLGLEKKGGGILWIACNDNDNRIYLEACSSDGSKSADELLLTGNSVNPVPKLSLLADTTYISGNVGIAGDVGIGTTAPKATLHNAGDYYGKGHIWLHAFEGDGKDGTAYVQARDTSEKSSIALQLRTHNSGQLVDALRIDPKGNVGIGTASPEGTLELLNSNRGKIRLFSNTNVGHDFGYDGGDDSNFWFVHIGKESGETKFRWDNGSSSRDLLVIKNTGNVGIGTTEPKAKLDVSGDLNVSASAIKLGLEKNGGGRLVIACNPNDNKIYMEAFSSDGTKSADELLLTGASARNVPKLSLLADTTYISGNVGIGTNPDRPLTIQGVSESHELLSFKNNKGITKWHWNLLNGGVNVAETGVMDGRFFIKEGGKVGIGTTTPETKLTVIGGWPQSSFGDGTSDRVVAGTYQGQAFLGAHNNALNAWANLIMQVGRDACVGIGAMSPKYKLHVDGSAGKPGGGSWADSSDNRLKRNVRNLTGALDKLIQLQGVTFKWINPDDHGNQNDTQASLIAQEVEKVFPEWVSETDPAGKDKEQVAEGEKVKTLQFPHGFNAYLIEAIKELKAQNDELRSQSEELRTQTGELKAQSEGFKILVGDLQARIEDLAQVAINTRPVL